MNDINIEGLVERLKGGDNSAADEIYRQYSERLTKFVIKQGLSEFDAQDVVSDTFVEMMKHIDQLKDPSNFDSWIHTIAKRKAWKTKKKLSRRQDLPTGTDDISDQEQAVELEYACANEDTVMLPQDYVENEDRKRILAEQLNALSNNDREVLYLYYYENKSLAEIAELTGTTENNAKQRLFAARKKLKVRLEKLQKSGVMLAVPLAKLISFFAENSYFTMDTVSAENDASSAGGYDGNTLNAAERPHNTAGDIIRHQANAGWRRIAAYAVSGICVSAVLGLGIFGYIRSSKAPDPELPDDSQGTTAAATIEDETSAASTTIAADIVTSTTVSSETTAEATDTTTAPDTTTVPETEPASEESTAVQDQPTEASADPADNTPDTPAAPDAEEPARQEQQPEPATARAAAATTRAAAVTTKAVTTQAATARPVVKPTLCGDANCDNVIDIEDCVMIINYVKSYSDMTWAEFCKKTNKNFDAEQSLANADAYRASDKREITEEDATAIMGRINGEYPDLPIDKLT